MAKIIIMNFREKTKDIMIYIRVVQKLVAIIMVTKLSLDHLFIRRQFSGVFKSYLYRAPEA